ncbi:MAG TPA: tetratricopeptide repeat protein, partial [Myxococcales bacterium]|nr:tetratricopeptide repeat protein [Myxococcales bacterium]
GDYLTLFPKNPKAYSLHFYHGELLYDQLQDYAAAAREYDWVVAHDATKLQEHQKPGKWFGKAAEDSVYAWEEVARQAGAKEPPPVKSTKELPIPPSQQGLVDACERYVKYFPNGPKVVEINYKVARIFYAYNHFAEAVKGFLDIALNHPDSEVATYSANLVLDSDNLLGDFQRVHDSARRFLSMPKLAKGKFRDDLTKIIEESGFKLVETEEKAGRFESAAQKYLGFAADFPKGVRADQALWNASIDFYKAGDFDASIKARRQIISAYPQSQLMPKALFTNAQSYESTADFAQAASAYERYAAAYEKQEGGGGARRHGRRRGETATPGPRFDEGKAQEGLINAAVYRAGLRQFGAAIKDREAYLRLWPAGKHASKADPSEQVFASLADVYEREGRPTLAIKQLEEHAKHVLRDPDAYLKVEGRLLKLYERSHNERVARKMEQDLLDFYKHSPKSRLSPEAIDVVAKASYAMDEDTFNAFDGQRLHLPESRLIKDVKAKAAALLSVQDQYTKTVKLGSGDPAICSLWRIGLAYQKFAQSLYDAPVPPALRKSEQLVETYKDQISQQAMPAENKAKELYANAVQKSRELGIYNDCAAKAFQGLRKYDPATYGEVPEVALPIPARTAPVVPDGLLVAIGASSEAAPPAAPIASVPIREAAPASAAQTAPPPEAAEAPGSTAAAPVPSGAPSPATDQEPNF